MKSGNKQKGFLTGGSVLEGMGRTQDEQIDKVAKRLENELAGDKTVMRLPGELKWYPYSISPADAQILENRKFSVFDVCRFFGVHPDKVFVEQTSNYKASENSQTSFMTDTLQPLLVQIEAELSTKLIPKKLVGRSEVILYDRAALYQLDPKNAALYYKDMFGVGGLTSNEIRIATHREPVEGGDVAFVSANVAPINAKKIYGESLEK
jgi:HK97 family phage portal protein